MNKLKVPIIIGSIALLFLLAIGIYKVGVATKLFGPKDDINSGNISTKLLDNDEYKDISLDKINYIEIIKYTEGGDEREKITDQASISRIYNSLNSIELRGLTDRACEDNTTIYAIFLKNGVRKAIEFECDWIIINGKRYNYH
ncbi:MAG: hypothetical protein IJH18_00805 [Bacilli bacterium]|nr:hypothetical protein [Bacilli bacterium]